MCVKASVEANPRSAARDGGNYSAHFEPTDTDPCLGSWPVFRLANKPTQLDSNTGKLCAVGFHTMEIVTPGSFFPLPSDLCEMQANNYTCVDNS